MGVDIRHAEQDDIELLLDLWKGYTDHLSNHDERYKHKDSAEERWQQYFENQLLGSKYGTVIVAENNDRIVGVLEARLKGDHPIFQIDDHGYINGHFVLEEFRETNVPEKMIEAALKWFKNDPHSVEYCRIDVLDSDQWMTDIYSNYGFDAIKNVYEIEV